ncbi:hypothetical protein I4F81_001178 [Pyropia yezoensis]|uniref:Uncharacterized protein n=1 Tax=Pyropia yezoensis TaxID=2788 RepID=A0ACC3BL90_PYRYE|nr:hypothetical protein I4F81_001178 [Neopyropia yezoensis]
MAVGRQAAYVGGAPPPVHRSPTARLRGAVRATTALRPAAAAAALRRRGRCPPLPPASTAAAAAAAAAATGRRHRVGPPTMDAAGAGVYAPDASPATTRVVVFGATGYIGRYVVREFVRRGYAVTAFARPRSGVGGKKSEADVIADFPGARVVFGDVTDRGSVATAFAPPPPPGDVVGDANTDAADATTAPPPTATVVVSCLASRTGGIADSVAIDYEATAGVMEVAREATAPGGVHFVLLSAVCVQKPLLAFQHAKLRMEAALTAAAEADPTFSYAIVRPTAFFKSLAGQVARLQAGKSYIMFGDGDLSKCNALSEADLARFIADAAAEPAKRNAVLPVGGPGAPVTPAQQAEMLFGILGKEPKYTRVPIGVMDGLIGVLGAVATVVPPMRDGVEFGKIGRYYATEDMVAEPYGEDTLEQFFRDVAEKGLEGQELGDAAVF